jgi:hypothetical protein
MPDKAKIDANVKHSSPPDWLSGPSCFVGYIPPVLTKPWSAAVRQVVTEEKAMQKLYQAPKQ